MAKEEKKEISIDEAIENIQNQLQNYKIMTIKAEGALEVLMQLKAGGVALSFWEVLPDMLRLGILIATLIHILIKIVNDYNK
jgi:hypothetical protein